MPRSVLVPFDDSDLARGALRFAVEEYPRADVTVLNVREARDHAGTTSHVELQEVEDGVAQYFQRAREIAREDGHRGAFETAVRSGQPHRAIVDHVERSEVDLIVMGTHGRRGAERVALGSVAERVVRRAPVPVLVYR